MALPFVDTDMIIDADQTPATGAAIVFNALSIDVTIAANVNVISRDTLAVGGSVNGKTLINNGNIFSAANVGVYSADFADTTIVNNAGATIVGLTYGIFLDDDGLLGSRVTNHGSISGLQQSGVHFGFDSENVTLNNDGDIFGRSTAVTLRSLSDGGAINNSGTIRSEGAGLQLDVTVSQVSTVIQNTAAGLIQGSPAIFTNFAGKIALDNRGKIDGGIQCDADTGNVDDVVLNRGKIIGQVHLGSGDDRCIGKGGGTSGKVFGEDGNDTLIGGNKNDTFDGGPGNDLLEAVAARSRCSAAPIATFSISTQLRTAFGAPSATSSRTSNGATTSPATTST